MKIITNKELESNNIKCTIVNSPILLGLETGRALEMGFLYGESVADVIDQMKELVDIENNVIYLYESFNITGLPVKGQYIIRFTHEPKGTKPVIVKEINKIKYQDFINMFDEETAMGRIKKDLKIIMENKI